MPMLTASALISVVCCGILYFALSYFGNTEGGTISASFGLVGGFYLMGIFAIVALQATVMILAFVRYYKSIFTDEGYLTMVLPMSSTAVINSKILYTLTWWTVGGLMAVIELFVSVLLPILLYDAQIVSGIFDMLGTMISMIIDPGYTPAIMALNLVSSVFRMVEGVVLTIAAITIGAMVMKKRRLLGAFLSYFGISFVRENVVGIFEAIIDLILISATNASIGSVLAIVFSMLISVGITAGAYLTVRDIFTKKFNIE